MGGVLINRASPTDENKENTEEEVDNRAAHALKNNIMPSKPSRSLRQTASEVVIPDTIALKPALVPNQIMINRNAIHKLKSNVNGGSARSGLSWTRSMAVAMKDPVFTSHNPTADYPAIVLNGAGELAWAAGHADDTHDGTVREFGLCKEGPGH